MDDLENDNQKKNVSSQKSPCIKKRMYFPLYIIGFPVVIRKRFSCYTICITNALNSFKPTILEFEGYLFKVPVPKSRLGNIFLSAAISKKMTRMFIFPVNLTFNIKRKILHKMCKHTFSKLRWR